MAAVRRPARRALAGMLHAAPNRRSEELGHNLRRWARTARERRVLDQADASVPMPRLPLFRPCRDLLSADNAAGTLLVRERGAGCLPKIAALRPRSEEHTSELQSHLNLVC